MTDTNPLIEIESKIPELQSELNNEKLYFYINIKNQELFISLVIYAPKKSPYKINIFTDARYTPTTNIPDLIINKVDKWLLTFDTVKNRQQKRNQIIKQELSEVVLHPDRYCQDADLLDVQ